MKVENKNDKSDIILKEIAERYADTYGDSLLAQKQDMDRQNVRYMMPRADAQIKELIERKKKRRKTIGIVASIAASIVLLISVPAVISGLRESGNTSSDAAPGLSEPGQNETIDWNLMQPLSFDLPAEFTVADTDLDNGMSVYYLTSGDVYDDVILTMEEPPNPNTDIYGGTETILIDGESVPVKVDDAYKLLTFEKDGRLYTLSCKEDIRTLCYLYASIAAASDKT